MKTVLSLATTCAVLAACASDPTPRQAFAAGDTATDVVSQAQCFRYSQIRNHTKGDDRTLYLDVAGRSVYKISMAGACLAGATSSDPLIITRRGGSDLTCNPIDLDIKVGGAIGPRPCIVSAITRLTPEQAAALPPKVRP